MTLRHPFAVKDAKSLIVFSEEGVEATLRLNWKRAIRFDFVGRLCVLNEEVSSSVSVTELRASPILGTSYLTRWRPALVPHSNLMLVAEGALGGIE